MVTFYRALLKCDLSFIYHSLSCKWYVPTYLMLTFPLSIIDYLASGMYLPIWCWPFLYLSLTILQVVCTYLSDADLSFIHHWLSCKWYVNTGISNYIYTHTFYPYILAGTPNYKSDFFHYMFIKIYTIYHNDCSYKIICYYTFVHTK